MSGHTPGPYRADVLSGGYIHARATPAHAAKYPKNKWIQVGHVCSFAAATPAEVNANLQLFAAAPDLLAACQSAVASFKQLVNIGRIPPNFKGLRDALAAISVATGEPQGSAEGRGKENPHA
jgi:hypothetical protein